MRFVNALNQEYMPTKFLSFDDVLLVPQSSDITSRNSQQISLQTDLLDLQIPIISSNMDTVTESQMAIAMDAFGGLGILHRFYPDKESYIADIYETYNVLEFNKVAISVGINEEDIITDLHDETPHIINDLIVCVDVAHGHLDGCINKVKSLRKRWGDDLVIIAGNVATVQGYKDLCDVGASVVKLSVGSGSLCSTRIVTGHGVPLLTTIMLINHVRNQFPEYNRPIIADGGIRNSGDIVKALAAGADAVMIGRLLSGCIESPGKIVDGKKLYRGQSSQHFLNSIGKNNVAPEGENMSVPVSGRAADVIQNLLGGVRSGMSYTGAHSLRELREKAIFIEITANGYIEGTPHGLYS